jgi:hypothetical protein
VRSAAEIVRRADAHGGGIRPHGGGLGGRELLDRQRDQQERQGEETPEPAHWKSF